MDRIKLLHEGETVNADEMSFKIEADNTMGLRLEDGTLIKIKHEMRGVYRLCDKKKEDGTPIYVLVGGVRIETIPAEEKQ